MAVLVVTYRMCINDNRKVRSMGGREGGLMLEDNNSIIRVTWRSDDERECLFVWTYHCWRESRLHGRPDCDTSFRNNPHAQLASRHDTARRHVQGILAADCWLAWSLPAAARPDASRFPAPPLLSPHRHRGDTSSRPFVLQYSPNSLLISCCWNPHI